MLTKLNWRKQRKRLLIAAVIIAAAVPVTYELQYRIRHAIFMRDILRNSRQHEGYARGKQLVEFSREPMTDLLRIAEEMPLFAVQRINLLLPHSEFLNISDEHYDALLKLASHNDLDVRAEMVRIFACACLTDHYSVIQRGLTDPSSSVRYSALQVCSGAPLTALKKWNPDLAEQLEQAILELTSDEDDDVRGVAYAALGYTRDSKHIPHMLANFDTETYSVQRAILEGLRDIPSERSLAVLRQHLKGNDTTMAATAVDGIGNIGQTQDIPELIAMLHQDDREYKVPGIGNIFRIHSDINLALWYLTCRNLDTAEQWDAWWQAADKDKTVEQMLMDALPEQPFRVSKRFLARNLVHMIPEVMEALAKTEWPQPCYHMLAYTGDRQALITIAETLGDEPTVNTDWTVSVLSACTGRYYGTDKNAWLAFLKEKELK